MQQVATLETVGRAIQKLEAEGVVNPSGRAVMAITGGSMATVLKLMKERRANIGTQPVVAKELPGYAQDTLLKLMNQSYQEGVTEAKNEIDKAQANETEALDALEAEDGKIKHLTDELTESQKQADQDRQEAEKAGAEAAGRIRELEQTVAGLQTERKQLIEAGEIARTTAAESKVQVDRADKASAKAESRVRELEDEVKELRNHLAAAEQRAAVAETHSKDMDNHLTEIKSQVTKEQEERTSLGKELKTALAEASRAQSEASKIEKAAQARIATLEKEAAVAAEKTASLTAQLSELKLQLTVTTKPENQK